MENGYSQNNVDRVLIKIVINFFEALSNDNIFSHIIFKLGKLNLLFIHY